VSKTKNPLKNNFIFFLLSPFLGFVQAFKYHRESWAQNSIWLFVIFYGYTMCHPEIMDSSRYVANLVNLYNNPMTWDLFTANFYSEESDAVDIYQPLVTFILSRFTKDGNVLFAVFGIVYGYFFSRNIWLLLNLCKKSKVDQKSWLLIISFVCVIGFWNLNGVRMWTAAHVFFYGAFQYLVNNKRNGIAFVISSMLIHFSYILPIGVFLLFILIRIPWQALYFFFVGSFSISSLNITAISTKLESVAPAFLLPRVTSYTSEEYVESVSDLNESANWSIKYYSISLMWVIVLLFTLIYFSKINKFKEDKSFSNLFGFSLLISSVGNITSLLPSGGRYVLLAQLFGVALLVFYHVRFKVDLFGRWLVLLSPLLYFFIIVSIRISFDTISVMTILGNPILALLVDLPIPLIDVLK
jgi:hypothetical protein